MDIPHKSDLSSLSASIKVCIRKLEANVKKKLQVIENREYSVCHYIIIENLSSHISGSVTFNGSSAVYKHHSLCVSVCACMLCY